MARRVTAPTEKTLLGIGTHAVPDLNDEQCDITYRALKKYEEGVASMRESMNSKYGVTERDYTPLDRQLDILRGVVTSSSFGKRVGGLLDMFKSSDAKADQLEIEAEANAREAETGGMLKRHITHSDGPPRDYGEEGDRMSILAEPPSTTEIEQADKGVSEQREPNYDDPHQTLLVILSTIAPDDFDDLRMLEYLKRMTPAQREHIEKYCGYEVARTNAEDPDSISRVLLPRALFETMIVCSKKYGETAAQILAEHIDDSDSVDVKLDTLTERAVSMKSLTERQLACLIDLKHGLSGDRKARKRLVELGLAAIVEIDGDNRLRPTELGERYLQVRQSAERSDEQWSDPSFTRDHRDNGDPDDDDDESGVASDPGYGGYDDDEPVSPYTENGDGPPDSIDDDESDDSIDDTDTA